MRTKPPPPPPIPNLMPLELWNATKTRYYLSEYPRDTGLACPKCNNQLQDTLMYILCTDPPQRDVKCTICNYIGLRVC